MSLKDRLNELAEAVRKSNKEFKTEREKTGFKGAVVESFSKLGFIKNRADRVINQLNQAQWVAAHEPGFYDSGLAHKLQETKAILEKSSLLDGFDNIVPVGKLRNWIDQLAASSTSYAAIRSFQKREQVKSKLSEFSKKLENKNEDKAFKKARKNLNETNQKLFEDLIELREGRRIQEGALKMQGTLALREEERERVEQAIKDRVLAETLISAQISANLEVFEGETDLNNKKIALIGEASDKIETSKRQYLDKQGYMTYLFNRNFKLADGFSAEVDKNGIVVIFDKDGNAIAPNDPVLDTQNPDGIIQVDESSKGDMFAESIADFEEFSTENIGLNPKSMASRYSRAMKTKVKNAIAEGKAEGYLTGEVAKSRMAYVNGLLETLEKHADKEHYKKTREYKEYQEKITRTKMALDAERYNLYERVASDYRTLLGEDAFKEFAERIANLPEKSARAKAYSELRREIVEGLPSSILAIGTETLDQMAESLSEIQSKQREITEKYVEPFLGAFYLSQGPLVSIPAKAPDGTYLVYDPESKAGKENGGVKAVATFEEAKKYYSFLESPEKLEEFLKDSEFRKNSSIEDMSEAEFLAAIENHQLIPTKTAEYKESYDKFISQTVSLEYARDKAIDEVQKGVAEGEVQLNETTRAFLAPNEDGKQVWFIEENGETRELLDNSELLSLDNLEDDASNGFIETKLMPIKLQELDKLSFDKENGLVDENGNPVFDESDKEIVEERISNLHERYQQEYIDNIIENARATMSPSGPTAAGPSGPTPSGPSGPTPTGPSGPTPTGPAPTGPSGPTPTGPSGPTPSGPSGPAPTGPSSPTPTGPMPGGSATQYKTKAYKVGDVNVAGIIKFLQIKKFMSYDLIIESASRLATQYRRLATNIPTPVYNGSYTIAPIASSPSGPAPTGPSGPTPTGPSGPDPTGPSEPAAEEESSSEPTAEEDSASEPTVEEESPSGPDPTGPSGPDPTGPSGPTAEEDSPSEPTAEEDSASEPTAEEDSASEPTAEEDSPSEPTAEEDSPSGPTVEEESPSGPDPTGPSSQTPSGSSGLDEEKEDEADEIVLDEINKQIDDLEKNKEAFDMAFDAYATEQEKFERADKKVEGLKYHYGDKISKILEVHPAKKEIVEKIKAMNLKNNPNLSEAEIASIQEIEEIDWGKFSDEQIDEITTLVDTDSIAKEDKEKLEEITNEMSKARQAQEEFGARVEENEENLKTLEEKQAELQESLNSFLNDNAVIDQDLPEETKSAMDRVMGGMSPATRESEATAPKMPPVNPRDALEETGIDFGI